MGALGFAKKMIGKMGGASDAQASSEKKQQQNSNKENSNNDSFRELHEKGWTLLMVACSGREGADVSHVRQLVSVGVDPSKKDSKGRSPFGMAVATGQCAIVRELLALSAEGSCDVDPWEADEDG